MSGSRVPVGMMMPAGLDRSLEAILFYFRRCYPARAAAMAALPKEGQVQPPAGRTENFS